MLQFRGLTHAFHLKSAWVWSECIIEVPILDSGCRVRHKSIPPSFLFGSEGMALIHLAWGIERDNALLRHSQCSAVERFPKDKKVIIWSKHQSLADADRSRHSLISLSPTSTHRSAAEQEGQGPRREPRGQVQHHLFSAQPLSSIATSAPPACSLPLGLTTFANTRRQRVAIHPPLRHHQPRGAHRHRIRHPWEGTTYDSYRSLLVRSMD